MPIIGIGLWQVPDPQEAENAVYEALKAGYRLIDTAAGYLNEEAYLDPAVAKMMGSWKVEL